MLEKVKQFNEGNYEMEAGILEFPMQKLELMLRKGEVREGSFFVTSRYANPIHGYIYSSHFRMKCLTQEFCSTYIEMKYKFDSTGMEEGDALTGEFCIVSGVGEYYLPFSVVVEHTMLHSSMGHIRNMFHFANLAKMNWGEAVSLFYSRDFKNIFSGNDGQYLTLYLGLSNNRGNEQNVEEFLLAVRKKQPVTYTFGKEKAEIEKTDMQHKNILPIKKNGWGYTKLNVSVQGDFLSTEKEILTEEDFPLNHCEVSYRIVNGKLHAGINYGKIIIENGFCHMEFPVTVRNGKGIASVYSYKKEIQTLTMQMMDNYLRYRTGQVNQAVWARETEIVVEKMNALNKFSIFSRLYQAHMLIEQEKYNEAQWILNRIAAAYENKEELEVEPSTYSYFLYLTTLYDRSDERREQILQEVTGYYHNHPENHRLLWVLLHLDEQYEGNSLKKYLMIEEQFHKGANSPLLYLEAYGVIDMNPVYLTKLEDFELQLLQFGFKYKMYNQDLIGQLIYLSGKQKSFSEKLLHLLEFCYQETGNKECLQNICTLLIKGNQYGKKYLHWFELAVQNELRITRLFEYYMLSVDLNSKEMLPKMVYMYFSYQSSMDYIRTGYLYANVCRYQEQIPELYKVYEKQMEHFAEQQLLARHINMDLAFLYQTFISREMLNEELSEALGDILFLHQIEVENEQIRKVVVVHEQLNGEEECRVVGKKAMIPIYSGNHKIFLEDAYGNRYVDTYSYSVRKLLLTGKLGKLIETSISGNIGFRLYVSECQKGYHVIAEDTLEHFEMIASSDRVREPIKKNIREKLLRYYFDNDMLEKLDEFLITSDMTRLSPRERAEVVGYMVIRDMQDMAYAVIKQFGFEFLAPNTMIRICSYQIQQEDEDDMDLLAITHHTFLAGKYDERILSYLIRFFAGNLKQMRDIWTAAVSFELDATEIAERIILQILFSNAYISNRQEIFSYYYKRGAARTITNAYLSQSAYEFFVRDQIIDADVFLNMKEVCEEDEELSLICKIAFVKYYADHYEETDENIRHFISDFIGELLERNIYFSFFQAFAGQVKYLRVFASKSFVEYKAEQQGSRVIIHYIEEKGSNEEGEYCQEEMLEVYEGNFIKGFTLFFGEHLQYYITEENGAVSNLSESGMLKKNDIISPETECRYSMLNDSAISQELHDFDTLDELMEEYGRKSFLVKKLFTVN